MDQEYFLQVIGCGDAFNHGRRLHTAFFYHTPSHNFLIDCGATTLLGLHQNNISTDTIDTIIITHLHGDHFGGLPFVLLDMHKIKKRKKVIHLIMPAQGKEKLKTLFQVLYPGADDTLDELPIDYQILSNNINHHGFAITTEPVLHSPHLECFGISIIDDTKKFAYSGDTEWTENLFTLANAADLFICECNFLQPFGTGHLNYQQLINNREKLNYKKLLLTHLGEKMLEEKENLQLPAAEDGKIYYL